MESTDPGRPRRRWSVVLAAGALTIAGAAVVTVGVLSDHGPESSSAKVSCDAPPSPPLSAPEPATTAPDGGGLRVAEKGFTQVGSKGLTVSLGAVLENTSSRVAYRTHITFRVFNAQKKSAVPERSGEFLSQEIPVILPGQRVGVGSWTYISDDPSGKPMKLAGFEVDLGTTRWTKQDDGDHAFAKISARHQRTEQSSVDPATGTVQYSAESTYCRALAFRGVAVVFRNGASAIIGGSFDLEKAPQRCQPGTFTNLAGAFRSLPPGLDDSKTEIYVYCDVAPVSDKPRATDAPIN